MHAKREIEIWRKSVDYGGFSDGEILGQDNFPVPSEHGGISLQRILNIKFSCVAVQRWRETGKRVDTYIIHVYMHEGESIRAGCNVRFGFRRREGGKGWGGEGWRGTRRARYFYRILYQGSGEPLRNLDVLEGAKGERWTDRKKVIRAVPLGRRRASSPSFIASGTRDAGYYQKPLQY